MTSNWSITATSTAMEKKKKKKRLCTEQWCPDTHISISSDFPSYLHLKRNWSLEKKNMLRYTGTEIRVFSNVDIQSMWQCLQLYLQNQSVMDKLCQFVNRLKTIYYNIVLECADSLSHFMSVKPSSIQICLRAAVKGISTILQRWAQFSLALWENE